MTIEIEGATSAPLKVETAPAAPAARPGVMKNFDPGSLKIESNIPLPTDTTFRKGSAWTPLLKQLKPGESVFLKDTTIAKLSYVRAIAKRLEIAIALRARENGVRLWRTELPEKTVEDDGLN